MKIKFDADLDYQADAIRSVCDLFVGQESAWAPTTGARQAQVPLFTGAGPGVETDGLGIGNHLTISDEQLLANLRAVQLRNGLAPSAALPSRDFTVEMETGTGKTYVYLRTIFELNRRYGFTKFIVVVPSVAIKEGVYKSLQTTEEHLRRLYDNARYDYFVYDSQKLGQVRSFAGSDCVQVMVINIDAFRKSFTDPEREDKANVIHRPHDRLSGARPVEFIQATRPIVVVDEPQSVDTTPKSREAIASLHPLFTLRYSATHRDKHCQVYRLDAVDAYERRLVKQIEVAGVTVEGDHNRPYVRLLAVDNTKGPITARIELDVAAGQGGKVRRMRRKVRVGTDLLALSGGRELYDGYVVDDIWCAPGQEYLGFAGRPEVLRLGQALGGLDQDAFKRLQIRRTVEEHLDKERRLRPLGIKVLSLFFIDRVAHYRDYDAEGRPRPGRYARWFEEEYLDLARKPKYAPLFAGADPASTVSSVHDGYFAVDRRRDATGRERFRDSRGDGTSPADESAYQLIMRDKERLLSFESPLRFIFSHSALREGWDNPNVFQICTLREQGTERERRQTVGRGLRIAVNQQGERVHGTEVNTLTVVAGESFETFARELQQQLTLESGIQFGVVERQLFANLPLSRAEGAADTLGLEGSERLWGQLRDQGYLDQAGRIQDALRRDLQAGTVRLPAALPVGADGVLSLLVKHAGGLRVRDADARRTVRLNKKVYLSPEFKALWDRIKHRTTYRVAFDPDALREACVREIDRTVVVGRPRILATRHALDLTRGGVVSEEQADSARVYTPDTASGPLPDVVTFLQNDTGLTRRTIVEILRRCAKLEHFHRNPQRFMEQVSAVIRRQMRLALVDGIKYERIADAHYYAQELFQGAELQGYLARNLVEARKAVHEHVVVDFDVEERFARAFEQSADVKVYAKLPAWFRVDTPLGAYNPDWAVLVEREGQERLFFVVETKGSTLGGELRAVEEARIACGKAHFAALETQVELHTVTDFDALQDVVG